MTNPANDALAEIDAMKALAEALSKLDAESAARVLRWAVERFKATNVVVAPPPAKPGAAAADDGAVEPNGRQNGYEDFAELYNAAGPSTESERALVCGYYMQFVLGQADFTGLDVNSELKNLGHGVSNITVAFNYLKDQKPALVMQVRKDGNSKQARKKYKLTGEGKKAVDAKLRQNGGADS